ncbi:hypothetical protein chiPu_0016370 [Chiloscyllium punctatum]|uniref:Ig-like domain-containing protein n=1 Tax=Chiloscyllium punctatum TaxID=137246 RepID=A0A401T5G0_CHIPU|nr:hypothetical protein [Chiloscyllium punctatum]
MIVSTLFLSLLLTFLSCVQSEVVLTQPEAETGRPAGSLKLTCKTSGFDLSSSYMHWVRQVPGQGLEWLVYYYTSSSNNYAPAIYASKDTSKNIFTLDMGNLKIKDTAIYSCAMQWSGYFDYWGQGTMVTVTSETPSPPKLYGLVSSCQEHNTSSEIFGCLVVDYSTDVTKVTWKKGVELIRTGLKTYPSVRNKKGTDTLSSQLTLPESAVDCPSKIYCEVQHSGSQKSKEMSCLDCTWIANYEDDNSIIWTTASNFITLFFLSIFYSAAVTLVKVK